LCLDGAASTRPDAFSPEGKKASLESESREEGKRFNHLAIDSPIHFIIDRAAGLMTK
jgi:hypothetical protein